jgi:phage gp45-like
MGFIRGIIQSVVEAAGAIKRFTASGRSDETITDREAMEHYGFTSWPLDGAEAVIISEGNHFIMIASDDRRYRIGLEKGEVSLYDDLGQKVHLARTGIVASSPVKITATAPEVDVVATTKVTMTTPLLEVSGNIAAGGQITDGTRSMAADRAIYNSHRHNETGSVTGAPNQGM